MSAAPRFSTADIARGAQRAEPTERSPEPIERAGQAERRERLDHAAQSEPDAATFRVNEAHHILEAREPIEEQQRAPEQQMSAARQAAADRQVAVDEQVAVEQQVAVDQQVAADRQVREDRQLPEDTAAPLFAADAAVGFQRRWDTIQAGFVDDPRHAVEEADALVAETMQRLAETFAQERERLEQQLDQSAKSATATAIAPASTEELRIALRHYRSFFKRLLSV